MGVFRYRLRCRSTVFCDTIVLVVFTRSKAFKNVRAARISVGSGRSRCRALYVTCDCVGRFCVCVCVCVCFERERRTHATQHDKQKSTREPHVSHEIESYTDRGRHMTAGPSGEMGDIVNWRAMQ